MKFIELMKQDNLNLEIWSRGKSIEILFNQNGYYYNKKYRKPNLKDVTKCIENGVLELNKEYSLYPADMEYKIKEYKLNIINENILSFNKC